MTEIITRAKGVMDGAATLPEAAARLRECAAELDRMHAEGYRLEGPVEEDYGHVLAPGEEPGGEDEEESGAEVSGEAGVFTYFPPESGMDDRAAMDNGIVG